jgi:hypothetical protein
MSENSHSSDHQDISTNSSPEANLSPNASMDKPCGCGSASQHDMNMMLPPSFVYAIGKVVHRFPNKSLEMELAQAIGRRPEVKFFSE